jgi:general secretion pathway protein F
LEVILKAPELQGAHLILAAVRDRIREGESLSAAMRAVSERVTAFEEAVIAVGEKTGALEEAIERLAGFLEEQESLREKLQTAMLYPVVVLSLSVIISGLILGFMLPAFQKIFAETNMQLPWMTRFLLFSGRAGGFAILALVLAVVIFALILKKRMKTDFSVREKLEKSLLRLPIYGKGYREVLSLRFSRVLAFLLERGIGLVQGIAMAGHATGCHWLASEAAAATDELRQGQNLPDAIRRIRALHPSLAAWVQAGESGGNLPELLTFAANRFQASWERLVTRGTRLLEMAMTLLLGIFVAFIALAVLLPILQLNKGIAG